LFDVLGQPKWRTRPLQVTLFGGGGNYRGLVALSQMLDLTTVGFGGFVSDVRSIWATHHALVLPSRHEGLPLSLVEAMLCGRPAIVTDVAGNTELVEDNVTGFVAAAPTPSLFDDALERAWDRRSEWPVIGAAAARSVRQVIPADPAATFADDLMTLVGF
jgi:glycosyltransferase involved in cell wall biosynthesis